ncbi:MAG: hypothetical protein A2381_04405 [Bdellovibrionales bacterium RIFOXYB1_FULL_37_110]|nr:MAG: hypothetical protein A2381_04405 [Bdellovibrionales bacterium RIFOXYB1_FULL_37_110]OFZ62261.1 MAG: hypothetical protein A2577_12925 [Bdellovibrionales bacterium RIFOXYD1_FULL_36_51]
MTSAISNWAALIIQTLIGLVLTPFLIKSLGNNGYGSWVAIVSVWGYFGILTTGLGSSIIRYISKYRALGEEENLNQVVNSSFFIMVLFTLILIPVSYWGGMIFAAFFEIAADSYLDFNKAFFYLGLATVIMFYVSNFKSVAHGYERFKELNIMESIHHIIKAMLVYFLLINGFGLIGLAYANLLSFLFFLIMIVWYFGSRLPDIKFKTRAISKKMLGLLMSYSSGTLLISFANILRFNLDNLIIAKLVNMEMVAIYSIGAALINYISQFIIIGFNILMPRFTHLISSKNDAEMRILFLKSLFISSFLTVMMSTVSVIVVDDFLQWWLKKEFIQSATIFYILIFSFTISLASFPGITLFYAKNKHMIFAKITLGEAVINFALSIVLVLKVGFIGAAIATAVTLLFNKLIVQPYYVSQLANIKMMDYLNQMITPFMAGIFIIIPAYFLGMIGTYVWEFWEMVVLIVVIILIYYFLTWLLLRILKSSNLPLIQFWNFRK